MCYAEGRGVEQNKSEAVRCYLRAARSNDTRAQFNLGVCYQEAIGVEKDAHKAAKWYWRAANLGDAQAMYNLGCCYADGLGVEEDVSKASRWFAEAARRGYGPEVSDPKFGHVKAIRPPTPANAGGATSSAPSAPAPIASASQGEVEGEVASQGAAAVSSGAPARDPTDEEKRLFPGLVGLVQPEPADAPATRGVPKSIVEKLEEAEARRRRRGMHGEGDAADEDDFSGSEVDDAGDEEEAHDTELEKKLREADGKGFVPAGARRKGKAWYAKGSEERLVGDDEAGMVAAEVGLRVRLSRACQGQGVKGEDGVGTIQWIGNQKSVCHVKWGMFVCRRVCVCMCVCMCVCVCVCIDSNTRVDYMCVCVYIHVCIYVCVCVYMYVCMYVCIYRWQHALRLLLLHRIQRLLRSLSRVVIRGQHMQRPY